MSSRLPAWLYQAVTAQLDQVPLKRLRSGYAALSKAYGAHPTFEPGGDDIARAQAYLAARMPATYAAVEQALAQVPLEAFAEARSVLDLGAGPGTATWALRERVPNLAVATLVETDAATVSLAKVLAESRPEPQDLALHWRDDPALLAAKTATQHDIVLMSYSLEEAGAEEGEALVRAAWAAARQGLLIVEPGTPAGFARLLKMRDMLLAEGGHLVAPCPHALACPLAAGALVGDLKQKPTSKERFDNMWCHFGVRLERRGLHRQIKGGDFGYEDEKFSFLYFSRQKLAPGAPYRVLAWPKRISRHIELDLCSKSGKREKSFYNRRNTAQNIRNAARRLAWGDAWDPARVPESAEEEDFDD
jgi:ribosomal protein RSM22 (predicted rRNA methylase)